MEESKDCSGSSEILLDYYRRFGRQHGIEKYFLNIDNSRLNLQRASSESSLQTMNSQPFSKSFDDSLLRKNSKDTEDLEKSLTTSSGPSSVSKENLTKSEEEHSFKTNDGDLSEPEEIIQNDKEVHEILVVSNVTDTQTINLNIESTLEIKLPEPFVNRQEMPGEKGYTYFAMSNNAPTEVSTAEKLSFSETQPFRNVFPAYIFSASQPQQQVVHSIEKQAKRMFSVETQTLMNSFKTSPDIDVKEEPIRPTIISTNQQEIQLQGSINQHGNVSPISSLAVEQKLEWDSLGDIGYNQKDTYLVCAAAELDETQKRAVNRYCAEKGLKYNPNLIVVQNVQGAASVQEKAHSDRDYLKMMEARKRHSWKQIFQKYKDKYCDTSTQTALIQNVPDAESTAIKNQLLVNCTERSAQTNLVDELVDKSVQVDLIISSNDDLTNSTKSESNMSADIKSDNFCHDSSFVFVKGSQSNSEKIGLKSTADLSVQTNLESSPSFSSSSKKAFEVKNDSFEDELKMAIALMNSVLESKSMHVELKKSLVIKIMQKITNLKLQKTIKQTKDRKKSQSSETGDKTESDLSTLRSLSEVSTSI